MNRRHFFAALATSLAVQLAPRRVYSFLWDNPLVRPAFEDVMIGGLIAPRPIALPGRAIFEITGHFDFAEPGMVLELGNEMGQMRAGRIVGITPRGVHVQFFAND